MHSSRSTYRWDFNIIDIPIFISKYAQIPRAIIDQNNNVFFILYFYIFLLLIFYNHTINNHLVIGILLSYTSLKQ